MNKYNPILKAFLFMGLVLLLVRCGTTSSTRAAGGDSDNTVTVSTLKDIPPADVTSYLDTTTSSSLSALEAEVGSKWVEFCYMEQCLAETIRHTKEFDFFTCMMKAAVDSGVEIPADGKSAFYEITPPDFGAAMAALKAPSSNSSGLKNKDASIDTENFLIRLRLQKSGDTIKLAMCEKNDSGNYAQVEEFIIKNSSGNFEGTVRFNWSFGLQTEKGYMKLSTTCPSAESFKKGTCTNPVTLQNYFNGSFGAGGIDLNLSSPTAYTLVYDFAGQDDFGGGGSFDVEGKGKITSTKGCIENQASGSFPAMPPSEAQWMVAIPACASAVANATRGYCFRNDTDIDFSTECPLEPAPATGLCTFTDESGTECGTVAAGSIGKREGVIAQSTADGSFDQLLTDLDGLASTATRSTDFEDTWNCSAGSDGFTTVDMSNSAAAIACEDIFTELDGFDDGGESCDEQRNEDFVEDELDEGGYTGDEYSFDDSAGDTQEGTTEPDDEDFSGFDNCPFSTSCTNDFQCQQFADNDQEDVFTTANVECDLTSGCCELR